mgnify:FL=1
MDHIELQIINKTSTRSSSEDYERYCCICLNTNYDTFIKFDCCRQSIHQECFVKMILTNIDVKCPTCRCVYNKINDKIHLIDFLNTLDVILKCNSVNNSVNIEKTEVRMILERFFNQDHLFDYITFIKKKDKYICLKFINYKKILFYILCLLLVLIFSTLIFIEIKNTSKSSLKITEYSEYELY